MTPEERKRLAEIYQERSARQYAKAREQYERWQQAVERNEVVFYPGVGELWRRAVDSQRDAASYAATARKFMDLAMYRVEICLYVEAASFEQADAFAEEVLDVGNQEAGSDDWTWEILGTTRMR